MATTTETITLLRIEFQKFTVGLLMTWRALSRKFGPGSARNSRLVIVVLSPEPIMNAQ